MKIMVAADDHFTQGPDGVYATYAGVHYAFWRRYLDVFDEVLVLARMARVPHPLQHARRADGPGVSFLSLPDTHGPWQAMRSVQETRARLRQGIEMCQAHLLRVPSIVGLLASRELVRLGKPFALEVVTDPWDSLGPGTVKSIVRPLARRILSHGLRRQCQRACAVSYVTREALQKRYPPSVGAFSTAFSSIVLPRESLAPGPRVFHDKACRFIFVGSVETWYKGPDVLLRAFAILCHERPEARLTLVGGGVRQSELERLADELRIRNRVVFAGSLPAGEEILARLDQAELFTLASRQEGVPRAMIEAMARGLPCIGAAVGGIPELISEECQVPPGNPEALARKLLEVSSDPARLTALSRQNWEKSKEFTEDVLRGRWTEFYGCIRRDGRWGPGATEP